MENVKPTRFTKLDGLRGILSIMVALNHSFMVVVIPTFANVWQQNPLIFKGIQSKLQQLLMLLGNGGAAVTLFFLLSGLVLGQSLSRVNMDFKGLIGFWIKRIIRLYPVYAVLVIFTAIFMKIGFIYQTFPFSSAWFNWWMNFQMTFREFIYNLLFIHIYVGGVTWTLRVILVASFVFPVFYLINKKTSRWMDILICILLVISSFTIFNIPNFRDFRYLFMFYLGLMIPKFKEIFAKTPNWLAALALPFAVIILLGFRYLTDEYVGGVIEAIISFFIIGLACYGNKVSILNFLDGKILKFFGKISYSLYLIHFSVLYFLSKFMFQTLPNLPYQNEYLLIHICLFTISTAIATGISVLVYKYIELPSQNLSKMVGIKISVQ